MKIIRAGDSTGFLKCSAATIGVYDGIHRGHQQILSELIREGRRIDAKTVVVTFEPHPGRVISGGMPPLILPPEEKYALIEELKADYCYIINFSNDFAAKSPEDFVSEILIRELKVKSVVIGFNHAFGAGRRGNVKLLKKLGTIHGFGVKAVNPVKIDGQTVSSSAIRRLIKQGNIIKANSFLGRPFALKAKVAEGRKKGRALGFPTANLKLPETALVPGSGVYGGNCTLREKSYSAVLYCGSKPTFAPCKTEFSVEAHILGFRGEIYGEEIRLEFLEKLREDAVFNDENALREKIHADIKRWQSR